MKITQVLVEATQATVAFAFGRFNPAHQGHIAVWHTVEQAGANWFVGTNPTTIGPNDPLTFEQKSAWMEEIYPPISGHIVAQTSVLTLATYIFKKLGKNENVSIAYVTDETDWAWSGKLLNQYNGKEGSHGYYKFAQITHVPSPRVSSATALRDAARADDKVAFYHASGTDPKLKVNGLSYFDTVKQACEKYPLPVKKAKKVKEQDLGPNMVPMHKFRPTMKQAGIATPRAPLWSFQEIAQKLGISNATLNSWAFKIIGNFPEAVPGVKSYVGSTKYYNSNEVKRWVIDNNVRERIKSASSKVSEDEQKTVAKTWDQMTPQEKISGVKGRTVWNEKTRKYYTVFDVPVKQTTDEASLATMRDYFAGDEDARDPYEITKQRLHFAKDKNAKPNVDKRFRSPEEYEQWLSQNKLKPISHAKGWTLINKKQS